MKSHIPKKQIKINEVMERRPRGGSKWKCQTGNEVQKQRKVDDNSELLEIIMNYGNKELVN